MKKASLVVLVLLFSTVSWVSMAAAEVPSTLTYAGQLTDDGKAVDKTIEATFALYDAETGGSKVWSETIESLDVNDGHFVAQLGAKQPFEGVFDGRELWLEVTLGGKTLSPRNHVGAMPYARRAAHAERADEAKRADTVGDYTAQELLDSAKETSARNVSFDDTSASLDVSNVQGALDELAKLRARVDNLRRALEDANGNTVDVAKLRSDLNSTQTKLADHSTQLTSMQTDVADLQQTLQSTNSEVASVKQDVASVQQNVASVTQKVSSVEQTVTGHAQSISKLQSDVSSNASSIAANASTLSSHATAISNNDNAISANAQNISQNATTLSKHASRIGANESDIQKLKTKTASMSVSGKDVIFSKVNLHVRNGAGQTKSVDGTGNLVIGYDEARSSGSDKSGSHNLVVGPGHSYTRFGGIVAGNRNEIRGDYASVVGGIGNTASGARATVTGGTNNVATGTGASIQGGGSNRATASYASVSGGYQNAAGGRYASVLGGYQNEASGVYTAVCGGQGNRAEGNYASVSGGYINRATGSYSSVNGGQNNTAEGSRTTIGGGVNQSYDRNYGWRAEQYMTR